MTYKIIVSVICIIFIIALIGSNLKSSDNSKEQFSLHQHLDQIHDNLIFIDGEKINYTEGSKHSITKLNIDGTISNNIETTPLSLVYLSNHFYDFKNIYLKAIFKVSNIKNNPYLLKCNDFSVQIVNAETPYISVKTNKGSEKQIKDIEIKNDEYYSYFLGLTEGLLSFKIIDDPDTQSEQQIVIKLDNKSIDKLYIGDNFSGYPFINPKIFRKEPKNKEPDKIKSKPSVLKIFMEDTFNNDYRIKWQYDKSDADNESYYVIVLKDISSDDMILNLVVPVIYNNNYIYELKKHDLKFIENIITLRKYTNGVLSKPSNNLILTK
jgi:hypothetical protein